MFGISRNSEHVDEKIREVGVISANFNFAKHPEHSPTIYEMIRKAVQLEFRAAQKGVNLVDLENNL